jgi:hypothetical protein
MQNQVRTKSINIGIDFGTSYSKICFEDETKETNYVKLTTNKSKLEYKRSRVYFDYVKRIFYYQKPENASSIETINYFKYSMIDKSLPRSSYITVSNPKTTPEELCGVFFIACLIKQSKNLVENHYKKYGKFEFDWNITMGVPIDNYSNEFKSLYDMILQIAIKLSKELSKYSISLNDLDNFCKENQEIIIPGFKKSPNNTLSELYAESIAFLKDDNVREGLYAIVDIGGATVDMAVISKMRDESNKEKFKYGIIAKNIKPLGIEILIHKIAPCSDKHSDIRKLLKNNKFRSTDIKYKKTEEQELSCKMQIAFAELAKEVRDKRIAREMLINKQKGMLPIFLCGGGAKYKWYKSCISSTWDRILNTLGDVGFRLNFKPVEELKRYNNLIDHRLIISSGLAQDIQNIPDLDGFPGDYEEYVATIREDYNETLYQTQRERYEK